MDQTAPRQPVIPPGVFARIMLPFAVPVLLTLALVLLVGNHWPRDIAPGSSLKLAGLGASAITAFAVWMGIAAHVAHPKARKFLAMLCALTGLMGWPVWSVGVLPSINGAAFRGQTSVRMTLERLEVTHASKSRELYHWAWLKAEPGNTVTASGRYFIPGELHARLEMEPPATLQVKVAKGMLGAQIVIGYDQR